MNDRNVIVQCLICVCVFVLEIRYCQLECLDLIDKLRVKYRDSFYETMICTQSFAIFTEKPKKLWRNLLTGCECTDSYVTTKKGCMQ